MTLNEILQAIIDGKELQLKVSVGWQFLETSEVLYYLVEEHPLTSFRIKPSTVTINGFEVPAPLKTAVVGHVYGESPYKECFYNERYYHTTSSWDQTGLQRGLIHSTKENAIMSCKARLGIDPYKD